MIARWLLGLMLLPGLASAQTAFVVGSDTPVESFEASGYRVVEVPSLAETEERLGAADGPVLLYLGRTSSRPALSEEIGAQFDTVSGLLQSAGNGVAILVDLCPVPQAVDTWRPVLPETVLLALPAEPGTPCRSGALSAMLSEAASQRQRRLDDALSQRGAWVVPGGEFRIGLENVPAAATVAVVTGDTLVVTRPVSPVATGAVRLTGVTPVAATVGETIEAAPQVPQTSPSGRTDQVVVFNAQRSPERAARDTRPGYPAPSIIVGYITPAEPEDPLAGVDIAFDDLAARRALRAENPELFQLALDSGRLDPPAELMAAAIQSELARMQCYTSTVDGIWGNGSRGAVSRYLSQAGGPSVPAEPVAALFRQLVLKDDVVCPAPVVTTQRPAAQPTTRPAQPAAAPPPPAAAPSGGGRTIDPSAGGVGIFR